MTTPSIEITVNCDSGSTAQSMVGDLQTWLEEQAGQFSYRRQKKNPSTQDLGAILLVLGPVGGAMAGAFLEEMARDFAKNVSIWMRRKRVRINVAAQDLSTVENLSADEAEQLIFDYLKRQYPTLANYVKTTNSSDVKGEDKDPQG